MPRTIFPDWKPTFLAELRETCIITLAADAAGVTARAAYYCRERDPGFAADWDEALRASRAELVKESRRRAMDKSDTLMALMLKAHLPEVYRDKIDHKHEFADLTDEELLARVSEASGRGGAAGPEAAGNGY